MYQMLVPAKGRSGRTCLVLKSDLEQLIRERKIHQFCRSDGWLDIDEDQRKQDRAGYTGPERRACKIVDFSLFPLHIKEQLQRTHAVEAVLGYGQRAREMLLEWEVVAKTNLSVVIQGKTGTGKELVALMLHELSKRKAKPFIKMDCGAVPSALIESELFGCKKGSPGKLRLAHGGTIFLDDIASLSLDMQTRLLGFFEERDAPYRARSVKLDVRVVSATTVDLMDQIRSNQFRKDLFYRLNEFEIHLPSLTERPDHIFYLATKFLATANAELGKHVYGFSQEAIDFLGGYDWSGNILELKNLIRRAILFTDEVIEVEHLRYSE
jgi:DNA-binding NtrC family response regulator